MGQAGLILFIVLAALIFLVFIAGLFIFILQYRKRKIINEKEKQLVAMASIMQGQEAERARIAQDLHDSLGGILSGIKLNASAMKGNSFSSEESNDLFEKMISQLDIAIVEMRRAAHNMMPEALLKFGLTEAVKDYCDGFNESKIVNMKFVDLSFPKLFDKSTEVNLYRIIQELSNNAVKHADAKNIFIQLSENENILTLIIEDDGKGFNTDENTTEGRGLQNVKSRVDYLKGNLNIESEIGKGTTVTIEIPN